MIKTPHSSQTQSLAPDLTPLLDIIFIVMVFLLLTASVKLESLEVELPSSDIKNVSEVHKDSISVNILDHEPTGRLTAKSTSTGKTSRLHC